MSGKNPLHLVAGSPAKFFMSAPVPDKLATSLREKQVHSINHLIIVMLLVGLLNTAVVLLVLWDDAGNPMAPAWGLGLTLLNGVTFFQHIRGRKYAGRDSFAERKLSAVSKGALVHGMLWGALPLMVAVGSASSHFMAIVTVTAGMMFGGTFLLSRVPVAAVTFVLSIAVGVVAAAVLRGGMVSHLMGVLTCVYTFVLIYSVRWSHKQFVQQHLDESALSEQSHVISLLLKDFGESSSEWLWQTNENFLLEELPASLSDTASPKMLLNAGRSIFAMFQSGEAHRKLERAMRDGQPFRDIVLRTRAGTCGDNCWISITGKPIFEDGRFMGYRGVASNVTLAKQTEARIEQMAHYDELTGLPNRSSLLEFLRGFAAQPEEPGARRAVLCMDLDSFKVVNDTLGHQAADMMLRQVTNRLTETSLPNDFVARIASDGFALVVERGSESELELFLDRLSAYLSEPYSVLGATVVCTASIGVRLLTDEHPDALAALQHADLAMHHARKQGKGNWALFGPELEEKAKARLRGESDLRNAIDQGQLYLVYQPQLSAETHKVVGFEALARWEHPERGNIPPSDFIGVAEDSGMIIQIGEWIIRTAMEEAARLPEEIRMSINISPLQMNSPTLVSTIMSALAVNQLSPSRIDLEITESVLMADTGFALSRLRELRDMGFRISLDDFGTGYSSLSYLRKFPFHKIKIDQSFVRELETDPESRAITQATLTLAKMMGLRTTAEGVETLHQASFLREHGCDELQGYLAGKPLLMQKHWHLIEEAHPGFIATQKIRALVAMTQDTAPPQTLSETALAG
jgi:diguanylate cyclase (GGDEF)-like protein